MRRKIQNLKKLSYEDIKIAKDSSRILSDLLTDKTIDNISLQGFSSKSKTIKINLPEQVVIMILEILIEMSKGNTVTIRPLHAELTTQEAANIINVSRPFIVKQLEEGKIPYKLTGTRRKILLKDLLEYKENLYKARMHALDKLSKEGQDLNLGY